MTDVNQRFMAGLVPPNELSSATAQEARARMLAIEARTQRDVSLADLARLIGVAPDQPIDPTADLGRAATDVSDRPPDVGSARRVGARQRVRNAARFSSA